MGNLAKKTATISVRIDPDTKNKIEELYASFGITVSDAINMFFHKSLMEGGLPFSLKQPRYNAETEAAMEESRKIADGSLYARSYSSAQELFEELDKEC